MLDKLPFILHLLYCFAISSICLKKYVLKIFQVLERCDCVIVIFSLSSTSVSSTDEDFFPFY